MYSSSSSGDAAGALIGLMFSGVFFVISLAFIVAVLGGMWKVFTKAGQPGWAALVPIYNIYVLTQIVGRPAWWVVLPFASVIPVVGWIVALGSEIILMNDLSKSYGKDTGFTIGLVILPPVFIPILGWGQAQYVGPMATGFGLPATPGSGGPGTGYSAGPQGGYAPPPPPAYTPPAPPAAPQGYEPPAAPAYAPPAPPAYTPPTPQAPVEAPAAPPAYTPAAQPAPAPAAPVAPPAPDAAFSAPEPSPPQEPPAE